MRKLLSLLLLGVFVLSCSSVKKTQEALDSGNYDQAINIALENLRTKKTRKNRQPYVLMLEDAYKKAVARDLNDISYWEKDGNPSNLETIYETYVQLNRRQELVQPLLPLPVFDEDRNAKFRFDDYSDAIIDAKDRLSEHLYTSANNFLQNASEKIHFRNVYRDLEYLDNINPNFKDVRSLMEACLAEGTDHVRVSLINDSEQILPRRLEEDLLNFNTYGINNQWTVFHGNPNPDMTYDFEMEIAFRDIQVTPEQVRERQVIREKQVKDGWEYLYNEDGDPVKDSLGNKIKVDKMVTVRCEVYEFTQFKASQVAGIVQFKDLNSQQIIDRFPVNSEFVFEHIYADYDGDRRALDQRFVGLIDLRAVPFPTDEQMVYDTGEDLKTRIKRIISRNQFRN